MRIIGFSIVQSAGLVELLLYVPKDVVRTSVRRHGEVGRLGGLRDWGLRWQQEVKDELLTDCTVL
jgi:hypothetical protein